MSETSPTRAAAPPQGDTGAPGGEAPEDRRRKRLASYTVRNMVWSMLLVTLFVLAWWSMTYSNEGSQRQAPETTQTTAYVVEQAEWPVWVPDPGDEWVPTVVWYDARVAGVPTWHISYTSPEGEYVALHQAADVTQDWLEQVLAGAEATGADVALPTPAGARPWQEWQGPEGGNAENGYLLGPEETGGTTVVVHGTAQTDEVEDFLGSVSARD
ncbi:DUF4245 family protein [Ornithinimicrobium pekingense]|uniref:DUF4245 domain-containing protein n=1 Tax=Ornithinimicrobium pekingense TaxID=384677 RepID=A0ABQ2F661_9MICO|nr:DUF4245 family protein [Ornithinimicrobium pekingense]GGK65990.1 hypothetical protein GCM10011509_12860 [Ornithinimicrobium pekingense]